MWSFLGIATNNLLLLGYLFRPTPTPIAGTCSAVPFDFRWRCCVANLWICCEHGEEEQQQENPLLGRQLLLWTPLSKLVVPSPPPHTYLHTYIHSCCMHITHYCRSTTSYLSLSSNYAPTILVLLHSTNLLLTTTHQIYILSLIIPLFLLHRLPVASETDSLPWRYMLLVGICLTLGTYY